MAISLNIQTITAFKNLLGKSMSDDTKALGNEANGIFFNVPGSAVWIDPISANPATAISNQVALAVTADMIPDPTANNKAFFAVYSDLISSGAGVLTIDKSYVAITTAVSDSITYNAGQAFIATSADLTSGTVKERVLNAISPSFGYSYEAKPYDANTNAISVGDARNWIYQYNSGIFFQEATSGPSDPTRPLTLDLYVYIGETLTTNGGGGGGGVEWQNSVFTISDGTFLLTYVPTIGDRFLVAEDAVGDWYSYDDYIAEWSGTEWVFTQPDNGFAVKVDDEDNAIYHYEGSFPGGSWAKQKLGQVRAALSNGVLNLGITDYTASVNPLIEAYETELIFLLTFDIANAGTGATLNIDGLGAANLMKDDGLGNLVALDAGDIAPGIVYMVIFDGTDFQLFTNGSSGIGAAEDGDYEDGLFTDFTPSTPIGTAVDRFNEILKALAPPPAPVLSDWTGSKAGTVASGKLSFDTSNPITGSTYFGADTAPASPISVDGTWTISGKRLGIAPASGGNISGILNDQVVANTAVPNAAYGADTFGDAEKGSLKLFVNGIEIVAAELDLTSSTGSISTTSGGTVSGFTVSAQNPSLFPQGDSLDLFQNRTGTWLVRSNDANLRNGYNYIIAQHYVSGSDIRTLTRFEFIIDDSTTATVFSGQSLHTLSMTGTKKISGIDYHTGGSALYDVTVDNVYRNTYSSAADAIAHTGNTNSYGLLLSASSAALAASLGDETKQVVISNKTATLTSSGRRIINDSISLNTTVKRTVQSTLTGGSSSITNILLDNITSTATEVGFESFDAELYRLKDNVSYDLVADVASNAWDSTQSLVDGAAGHVDGLQVIDGRLIYPGANGSYPSDFTTANIVNGSTFNDGGTGGGARDYSSLTGDREYIRYFKQVSPTTANFVMNIAGTGGTFVALGTALTGNNIHVEIKLPTETGWMDAYADFATGQFGDGDGARSATAGAGRAFGTNWGLTVGTKNTANSGGFALVRITVGSSFSGSFDAITFTFS